MLLNLSSKHHYRPIHLLTITTVLINGCFSKSILVSPNTNESNNPAKLEEYNPNPPTNELNSGQMLPKKNEDEQLHVQNYDSEKFIGGQINNFIDSNSKTVHGYETNIKPDMKINQSLNSTPEKNEKITIEQKFEILNNKSKDDKEDKKDEPPVGDHGTANSTHHSTVAKAEPRPNISHDVASLNEPGSAVRTSLVMAGSVSNGSLASKASPPLSSKTNATVGEERPVVVSGPPAQVGTAGTAKTASQPGTVANAVQPAPAASVAVKDSSVSVPAIALPVPATAASVRPEASAPSLPVSADASNVGTVKEDNGTNYSNYEQSNIDAPIIDQEQQNEDKISDLINDDGPIEKFIVNGEENLNIDNNDLMVEKSDNDPKTGVESNINIDDKNVIYDENNAQYPEQNQQKSSDLDYHKTGKDEHKSSLDGFIKSSPNKYEDRPVLMPSPVENAPDSHFFAYFASAVIVAVAAYSLHHNRKKIMALVLEGRSGAAGPQRRRSRTTRPGSRGRSGGGNSNVNYAPLNSLDDAISANNDSSSSSYKLQRIY